jgi:hypothetical protein
MASLLRRLGSKSLTINSELDPERQSWEGLSHGAGSWGWPVQAGNESLTHDFQTYVDHAYQGNGIVFACILARQLVFSEARFQYRRRVVGRPGDYFGRPELGLLEKPWENGTTGSLLTRMESMASLAGNWYATTVDDRGRIGKAARGGPGERLAQMRPDWVTIVVGVPGEQELRPNALGAKILAYIYAPPAWARNRWIGGGASDVDEEVTLLPDEVVHYAPIPDPVARFRGMSWLTPVLREIESDKAATIHKRRFFKAGAVPSMAVSFNQDTSRERFQEFIADFKAQQGGSDNAYKPLFLTGADVKPMTFDMQQLDLKGVQGHLETRIAAAARVPPIIAGLSEGLSAATYSNYAQARRHFADMTMRPLWREAAGSLQPLVDLKDGSELWYDDRDVAFLREDLTAAADIQAREASTITGLISSGFEPDSVVRAVRTGDFALLKHSGLLSVQLQEPGAQTGQNDQTNGVVDPAAALAAARNGRATDG